MLNLSDIPACAFWPFTAPAPAAQDARFSSVPTLILSGADDLRTPAANAHEVAAEIPGSKLLVVPNVGHSVLDEDPTRCSSNALQALFVGKPVKPCAPAPPPPILRPTPLPPPRLADVAPARGNRGKPGRTLEAVLETVADSGRQLALKILAQLGSRDATALSSMNVGGLRSGWAGFAAGKLVLHGYSYVPGVTVSGEITAAKITLSVGGTAAAHGTLTADPEAPGPHMTLTGRLEGHEVNAASSGPSASGVQASLAALRSVPTGLARESVMRSGALSEAARLRAVLGVQG